jgi:hypothetical protein
VSATRTTTSTASTALPEQWVVAWPLVVVVDERRVSHHCYEGARLPKGVEPAELARLVALGAVRQA